MPDGYTFRFFTLYEHDIIGDLPMQATGIEERIGEVGQTQGLELPLDSVQIPDIDVNAEIQKWRVGLHIYRPGKARPCWAGIVTARDFGADQVLKLTAKTFDCLYGRDPELNTQTWPPDWSPGMFLHSDRLDFGAVLQVEVDPALEAMTGHAVEQVKGKSAADEVADFEKFYGFEHRTEPSFVRNDPSSPNATARFAPRLGRTIDRTGFTFYYDHGEPGNTIVDYTAHDPEDGVIAFLAVGGETNGTVPSAWVRDNALWDADYYGWGTDTFSDLTTADQLAAAATASLRDRHMLVLVNEYVVLADADPAFEEYQLGDEVRFAVSDKLTPRQPDGMPGRITVERVVARTLVPGGSNGRDTVKLVTNLTYTATTRQIPTLERRLAVAERRIVAATTTSRTATIRQPASIASPTAKALPVATSTADGAYTAVTDLTGIRQGKYLFIRAEAYTAATAAQQLEAFLRVDNGDGTTSDAVAATVAGAVDVATAPAGNVHVQFTWALDFGFLQTAVGSPFAGTLYVHHKSNGATPSAAVNVRVVWAAAGDTTPA